MSVTDIDFWVYYRATHGESIEQRHAEVVSKMMHIGSPFGFEGLEIPPAPSSRGSLSAEYRIKYPIRSLKFVGSYKSRDEHYKYEDRGMYDDDLRFAFKASNKFLDYRSILHVHFPRVIEAFRGYRTRVMLNSYDSAYCGGYHASDPNGGVGSDGYEIKNNHIYNDLLKNKSIDINGRNNIYVLNPANYWDAELCQRALGYGPDEVVARLQGKVPKIERLMDGVYVVFSDNIDLAYDDFLSMNERYKSVLGLI